MGIGRGVGVGAGELVPMPFSMLFFELETLLLQRMLACRAYGLSKSQAEWARAWDLSRAYSPFAAKDESDGK